MFIDEPGLQYVFSSVSGYTNDMARQDFSGFFAQIEHPRGIHLCGNVQRHFPLLVRELAIDTFDTGFPINFSSLRAELGPKVEIQGGLPVADLIAGPPAAVISSATRVAASARVR
jgi:hypothetical protein